MTRIHYFLPLFKILRAEKIFLNHECVEKSIEWLDKKFISSNLTFKEFDQYTSCVFSRIKYLLDKIINPKIKYLLAELNKQNYEYADYKYDNFVCNISDELDIIDIKIIDWSSGLFTLDDFKFSEEDVNIFSFGENNVYNMDILFKIDWNDISINQFLNQIIINIISQEKQKEEKKKEKKMARVFSRFGINGQFNMNNVFDTIWNNKGLCETVNSLEIPHEIKIILTTKINYNVSILK